jgi:hypothetical protein
VAELPHSAEAVLGVHFDIQPYIGALPITFGMRREEVHRLLGEPESSFPIWDGSGVSEHYAQARYNIGYDNDGIVNHLGFSPGGAELSIQGRPIWTLTEQRDPNPMLLALDPAPVEHVGFWIFLQIGVTSTGFHGDDASQRAVTVFPRGSKTTLLSESKPADTSRYETK